MHLFNLFCSTSTFVRLQSVSIMWVLGERQSFGDMLLYIWNFQPGVVLATRHRKEEMCKAMQGDFFVIAGDHWAVYLIIWVWKSIIHLPTKAAYTQMFCATLITKRQQGLGSQWFFANIDMNHTFPSTKSKRNESCISTMIYGLCRATNMDDACMYSISFGGIIPELRPRIAYLEICSFYICGKSITLIDQTDLVSKIQLT